MSRLQTSRYVAARVLAPSTEAFDTPLGPPRSLAVPGVCYAALRDLPRRDLHPLETNSVKRTVMHPLRHDTLQPSFYRWMVDGSSGCTELPPGGARVMGWTPPSSCGIIVPLVKRPQGPQLKEESRCSILTANGLRRWLVRSPSYLMGEGRSRSTGLPLVAADLDQVVSTS